MLPFHDGRAVERGSPASLEEGLLQPLAVAVRLRSAGAAPPLLDREPSRPEEDAGAKLKRVVYRALPAGASRASASSEASRSTSERQLYYSLRSRLLFPLNTGRAGRRMSLSVSRSRWS